MTPSYVTVRGTAIMVEASEPMPSVGTYAVHYHEPERDRALLATEGFTLLGTVAIRTGIQAFWRWRY